MAYFGDEYYTIKIDKLRTGEIRYLCWHKSNSILAEPNLILRNGKIKQAPNGESTEYVFLSEERIFTVEHIPSKLEGGASYFFIEVTDEHHKKSTWKMQPMPIPKYFRHLV
ncbi:hypothetical protein [Flagellimonas ruestringensis]|uniref:hypothetical protein n=1 Tax=Flagellimonas ruestringensis TaxID=111501 RepID=UPI0005A20B4D|nr:hypothetical protein [Allomuricauda ruestringensis]